MTVSAVTLAPGPVTGPGTGAFAEIANPTLRELADRASRPDYDRWLASTAAAGGCRRPVRLRGEVHDVDVRTGEILTSFHTTAEPDGVIYKACGDRRASVCPACAEIYRRDAYQLVRAGMAGGKGEVPESVAAHPCVFATFTAPSFGLVHTRRSRHGRLIRAAWYLGAHEHDDFKALRRWAHMLGFRGHFITKSRRYSVTFKLLRTARADWRRRQYRTADHVAEETTLVVGLLSYAGSGWRTNGDALLALTAAAKAREHDRIAREEIAFMA